MPRRCLSTLTRAGLAAATLAAVSVSGVPTAAARSGGSSFTAASDLRGARVDRLDHRQRHLPHWPFPEMAVALQAQAPHRPCAHPTGRNPNAR
jgi:hypothetical protein